MMDCLSENKNMGSDGVDSSKLSSDTKTPSKFYCFVRRAIKCVIVGVGTFAFPVIMMASGIFSLFCSCNTGIKRSVQIKEALKWILFSLPSIGPVLIRLFADNLSLGKHIIANRENIDDNSFAFYFIPFMSTFVVGIAVVDCISLHLFGKEYVDFLDIDD
ncbi:MAG: hypothetical protein KAG53_05155 [Endozoicomonadaceae bacterium]|nr:hypothetical protein [Endozoicomonadaceae bacterium]